MGGQRGLCVRVCVSAYPSTYASAASVYIHLICMQSKVSAKKGKKKENARRFNERLLDSPTREPKKGKESEQVRISAAGRAGARQTPRSAARHVSRVHKSTRHLSREVWRGQIAAAERERCERSRPARGSRRGSEARVGRRLGASRSAGRRRCNRPPRRAGLLLFK